MEGSHYHDKHMLFVQNFETSKMNDIVGVKRDKLMPYGWQRLNGSMLDEKTITHRKGP